MVKKKAACSAAPENGIVKGLFNEYFLGDLHVAILE
jgi:hypothetical protein